MTITTSTAAAALGSVTSEKKSATARENGRIAGERRLIRDHRDIRCSCGSESETLTDHKSTCRRRQTLYQRAYQERRRARLAAERESAPKSP